MNAQPQFLNREAFERLIRSLVGDNPTGCFGRLHIVSIHALAEDSDCPDFLHKAVIIAETILRSRLGPTDACLPLSTGQFMLVFSSLNQSEGAVRAAAIAREIKEHLVGNASDQWEVSADVLPLDVLRQATPNVESMRVAIETGHPAPGIVLKVEHQPVWDLKRERITGSRARVRRDFGGQTMYEHQVMFGGDTDPLAEQVNQRLAHAASGRPGDAGTLFVPLTLNDHTIGPPGGLRTFLSKTIRPDGPDVVVELTGAVCSLGRPLLRTIISDIRALGGKAAVRVLPERETAKFLRDSGADFLCLNQSLAKAAGFTAAALYALFTLIARDAAGLGFTLCLWNAGSAEDIKRAAGQGFTMFSGTPVGPTSELPAGLRPLEARRVFA